MDDHGTSPVQNSDSNVFWSLFVLGRPTQEQNLNLKAYKLIQCHLLTFKWQLLQQSLHFVHLCGLREISIKLIHHNSAEIFCFSFRLMC